MSRTPEALRRAIDKRTQPGTNGCLIWTGTLDSDGYPKIGVGRETPDSPYQQRPAHRVNWELTNGPIPEGHTLARSPECPNRRCVAPDHLELVEGVRPAIKARNLPVRRKPFPCGHPNTPSNYAVAAGGTSYASCRTCKVAHEREYNATVRDLKQKVKEQHARRRAAGRARRPEYSAT